MKILFFACGILLHAGLFAQPKKEIVYVGTYSIRDSKGIYVFELNRANGQLKQIQAISGLESPSYVEVHPSSKFLYSVNRGSINGDSFGSASAYSIDRKTGTLKLINHVSSFGQDPCHISIDKTGRWAFVSNYTEGNLVVLPILHDGSLGAPSDSKKYFGKSINKFRQEQPHIHSAEISADNRYVYVSDLGTDRIYTYSFNSAQGKLDPINKLETSVAAGAGPRHMSLHPNGGFAYSAQELTSTVGVFAIDKSTGQLNIIRDTLRTLPPGTKEVNTSADIHVDPKGKNLYVSNRGFDGITVFSIQPDGTLKLTGHEKTLGKSPRNFLIDRKGRFLWAANENSDNITIFKINPTTGLLINTKLKVKVPSPVCLKQLSL